MPELKEKATPWVAFFVNRSHLCFMSPSELHPLFLECTGVQTDTRVVEPGQMYFALRGDRFDGNDFAAAALERGAKYAVVDRPEWSDLPQYLYVPDVLVALQELATYHRRWWGKTVVGLTGSNGKTTAKELFARVAACKFSVLATQGNLNNHIGVPLTLLRLKPEHELAVVEMGANHQQEVYALAGMAQPNLGYITNYGKAHLEGFGGVEGVIKGKSELYQRLGEWGGTALVHANDAEQMRRSDGLNRFLFGTADAGCNLDFSYAACPPDDLGFAQLDATGIRVRTHLTGSFQSTNIAAALALGVWLRIPAADAAEAVYGYIPANNRAEWRTTEKNKVLLDAYNANPSSTLASLQAFLALPQLNQPLIVLGDMFELGEWADAEHQALLDWLELHAPECPVWTVGSHYLACTRPAQRAFATTSEALEALKEAQISGHTVLIKGSRGMALEHLLPAL